MSERHAIAYALQPEPDTVRISREDAVYYRAMQLDVMRQQPHAPKHIVDDRRARLGRLDQALESGYE
jgi:hypothetical protein